MKISWQNLSTHASAVLRAYSAVLFCDRVAVGGLLCAASMLSPWIGLLGLSGAAIALAAARWAGFERAAVDDGRLLFNSLLCSLLLGFWAPPGAVTPQVMAILALSVPLAALGCTVVLNQAALILTGSPARSLPFCVVGTVLGWLLARLIPSTYVPPTIAADFIQLPNVLNWWTQALGTIFFSPTVLGGLLATVALCMVSRLSFLFAVVGYAISAVILLALGFHLDQCAWLQLDAILCAVALGGVFFVPSRASLLLATVGAALCVLLGVALTQGLRWIGAPLLTLPFNLMVLGVAAALRWRAPGREPRAVLFPGKNPEATFQADRLWRARNPEPELPAIAAPFDGVWTVTQGFNDDLTHRAAWRHALDFEVADAEGRAARPSSGDARDFPSFNAPVLAPADGRVVRLVDDIDDNAIGGNNLADNWGNSIVIEIGPGLHVQLSHFRRRSFKVREGDRVRQGQLLGYLGNSGRSPVPHLHLQMQTLPDIGSPTIPFRLRGYRTPAAAGSWEFHFRGLPRTGDAIAGARAPRWLDEVFARGEEKTARYRVFTAQGEQRETIRQEWTPTGALVLHSLETKASAKLVLAEGIWTLVEFHGARQSLLSVFQGAGRVPLAAGAGAGWADYPLDNGSTGWFSKIATEWLAPFLGKPLRAGRGEVISSDGRTRRLALRWTVEGRSIAELDFAAEGGLASGRLETPDFWLRFLAEDAAPLTEEPVAKPAPMPECELV